ncbi:MAG: M6 family metalloprotease domain-containing protein [Campylobacterota bacterium]|nr:M6 family metalloprotease domain-containing protein [Campylobacterota bacterium]
MQAVIRTIFLTIFLLFLGGCAPSEESQTETVENSGDSLGDVNFGITQNKIPTLVVIMNWKNISEDDPLIWYDKIFNKEENSVNRWYYDSTDANIELMPIEENSGISNDGIISVNMDENHPGSDYSIDGSREAAFRDNYLAKAMNSSDVNGAVNFAEYDTDADGSLNQKELQVIFIIAGGEESYNEVSNDAIWAHAWSFESRSPLVLDNVKVISDTGEELTTGWYTRFGAVHGYGFAEAHKATVGIIAHEIGHSLLNLEDYYQTDPPYDQNNNGLTGSGLGYYDIMSGGSWAKKRVDSYEGDTPVQFSAYNKIDALFNTDTRIISSTDSATIKCSSNEFIKLITEESNEFFLLECRDSARVDSDRAFNTANSGFSDNKLFALLYHVDTNKNNNNEDGSQTQSNHYKVRLVERDTSYALTKYRGITVKESDSYTDGDIVDFNKVSSYNGSKSYKIEVLSSSYTTREMSFKITH